MIDVGVVLGSLGMTTLELSEASAVAIVYHSVTGGFKPFAYAIAGVATVFIPAILVGSLILFLPVIYVRTGAAVVLLYFGVKMFRSVRRYFTGQRKSHKDKEEDRGVSAVYYISAVEGLEAALVVVALMQESVPSALLGAGVGTLVVTVLSLLLKSQVRRVKVPYLKAAIASLLLSFSTFWFGEAVTNVSDLVLIPLFFLYFVLVMIGAGVVKRVRI